MTTDERIAEMSRQVAHARMERDATIKELAALKRQCDSMRAVVDAADELMELLAFSDNGGASDSREYEALGIALKEAGR